MRIVVTGGSGKAGRWVVRHLRERSHDVLNVDWRHDGSAHGLCLVTDLADPGQCFDALGGAEAVVHLAAIPAPELRPAGETFRINTLSTYNVFAAAESHRLRRVVYASSETVLGLPFDEPPAFAPIDESHPPRPESSYALSKLGGETMAAQFARRTGVTHVGLRISNIMEPEDYAAFPGYWDDPALRRWNLWGYVDARDVAAACERALLADVGGSEVCIIAAADTVMQRPSAELMAEVYPDVPLRRPVQGHETLLAIDHARSILGYEPGHSWRSELEPLSSTGGQSAAEASSSDP
ncbi:NAD(P)-dependent oxidoreductase [soil metagenome]